MGWSLDERQRGFLAAFRTNFYAIPLKQDYGIAARRRFAFSKTNRQLTLKGLNK